MSAPLLLVAWFGSVAHAVTVKFCVEWNVSYVDSGGGEDFLTTSPVEGRGALVRFVRPDGSYFGHYMTWNGTEPGCAAFDLPTIAGGYKVKLVREALVDGNTVQVFNTAGTSILTGTWNTGWNPTANQTYTIPSSDNPSARIMAAASWALAHRNGGVSGKTFPFIMASCPGGTSCSGWGTEGAGGSTSASPVAARTTR